MNDLTLIEKMFIEDQLLLDDSFKINNIMETFFFQKKYSKKQVRKIYEDAIKYGFLLSKYFSIGKNIETPDENTKEFYNKFIELCKLHNIRINYNFDIGLHFTNLKNK